MKLRRDRVVVHGSERVLCWRPGFANRDSARMTSQATGDRRKRVAEQTNRDPDVISTSSEMQNDRGKGGHSFNLMGDDGRKLKAERKITWLGTR